MSDNAGNTTRTAPGWLKALKAQNLSHFSFPGEIEGNVVKHVFASNPLVMLFVPSSNPKDKEYTYSKRLPAVMTVLLLGLLVAVGLAFVDVDQDAYCLCLGDAVGPIKSADVVNPTDAQEMNYSPQCNTYSNSSNDVFSLNTAFNGFRADWNPETLCPYAGSGTQYLPGVSCQASVACCGAYMQHGAPAWSLPALLPTVENNTQSFCDTSARQSVKAAKTAAGLLMNVLGGTWLKGQSKAWSLAGEGRKCVTANVALIVAVFYLLYYQLGPAMGALGLNANNVYDRALIGLLTAHLGINVAKSTVIWWLANRYAGDLDIVVYDTKGTMDESLLPDNNDGAGNAAV